MRPVISMRVQDGDPVDAGDLTVTPQSRVLSVRLANAAFVWSTPSSVRIERHGRITHQPIVDVTGIALVAIVAVVAVVVVGALAMCRATERN